MKKSFWLFVILTIVLSGCNVFNKNSGNVIPVDSGSNTDSLMTGSMSTDVSHKTGNVFSSIDVQNLGEGNFKLTGKLSGSFDKIEVTWEYSGVQSTPFTLRKYNSGSRVFEYNISSKFDNIRNGSNVYIFRGTSKLGVEETTSVVESFDVVYVEGKDPKYCLFDICIDTKQPFSNVKNILTQNLCYDYNANIGACMKGQSDEVGIKITIDQNKKTASRFDNYEMGSAKNYILNNGNYFVRYKTEQGCAGGTWNQLLLDKEGKKIDEINNISSPDIPRSFLVGNIEYMLQSDQNIGTDTYYYGTLNSNVEIEDKLSMYEDVGIKISNIAKKSKFLSQNYIVTFKEIPNLKLKYASKTPQSERVVSLGDGKGYLDSDLNVVDINITNKILSYYISTQASTEKEWEVYRLNNPYARNFVLKGDSPEIVESVNSKSLPIFYVTKLDGSGSYLLYVKNKKYEFTTFAEMCKPVVYVYTKHPENQKLTITPSEGAIFTKILPDFTKNNTRNYLAKDGKVFFDNHMYDYLYYSIKVKNYIPNNNGWIVKGGDINKFFEDKLPKIGFNTKEKKDFMEYRTKEYDADSYYFVSFKYNQDLDKYVKISFDKRANVFRVFMESFKVKSFESKYLYSNVGDGFDKSLIQSYKRGTDFDAFEWGGMLEDIIH